MIGYVLLGILICLSAIGIVGNGFEWIEGHKRDNIWQRRAGLYGMMLNASFFIYWVFR